MPPVTRILDANFNRAREALRVMEEAARFLLNDPKLSEELKAIRHELTTAVTALPDLTADRDTRSDVGTTITTDSEASRASVVQITDAAGSRLSESLRAIEEYAKVLGEHGQSIAATSKQLRYRGYDVSLALSRRLSNGMPQQWRLCLLLTEALCTDHNWRDVLDQAIRAGVDCVQVREKTMDGGRLLERVREVIYLVNRRAAVVVNDRPDIAMLAGADGVHLGQFDVSIPDVRRLVGRQLILGVSTSNLDQAKQAKADGADYCGIGPMFHTTTKRKDFIAGTRYLREFIAWDGLPHLAIGGIKPDNLEMLTDLGCQGIAISSAICAAQDPYTVARNLLSHLPAKAATHA